MQACCCQGAYCENVRSCQPLVRHIFQDEDWGGGVGSDWQPEEPVPGGAALTAAVDAALLGACLQQAAAAEGRGRKRPASEVFQPDVFQAEVAAADPRDLARLLVEEQQEQCILGTAGYVSSQPCGSAVKLKRADIARYRRIGSSVGIGAPRK